MSSAPIEPIQEQQRTHDARMRQYYKFFQSYNKNEFFQSYNKMDTTYIEEAFNYAAQAAMERLWKITGDMVKHSMALADWYGRGTIVLYVVPPSKEAYKAQPIPYRDFFYGIKDWCYEGEDSYWEEEISTTEGKKFALGIKTIHKQPQKNETKNRKKAKE